jgi:heme/copper-type cytochrome/quinol oxidase subunit 2
MSRKFITLLAFLAPALVFAQSQKLGNPVPKAGMTLQDFIFLLLDIIQLVLFPVVVVCIVYAGFLMVTAGGDEAQVSKSKVWIVWSIVGAAIIIGAKVIAGFIAGTVATF